MNTNTSTTLLLFLLYSLYVLVPLVPAVVIFSIFPDTRVAVQGPLQGLTVRAGGAFAAYMIVVLLSWYVMGDIAKTIEHPSKPVWSLDATVELEDPNGKQLHDDDLLQAVDITLVPSPRSVTHELVHVAIPGSPVDYTQIDFAIKNFGDTFINLNDPASVTRDETNSRLNIVKPVVIKNLGFSTPYNRTDYISTDLGRAKKGQ